MLKRLARANCFLWQVGYWRINEGPGAMVFDFSSYNNVGPIKGEPHWSANRVPLSEATAGS